MSERRPRGPALPAAGPHVEAALLRYLAEVRAAPSARQAHLLGTGAVASLERKLAAHYGKRHALAVANATGGLFAVALALELQGAEVVTTPLSWGGSLSGLLQVGGRPVFADVEAHTLALCPGAARGAITPATRALLAVDLFGVPADDEALRRLADEHDLWYIHDAAQSLGARRGGRPAGSHADVLVVSFTCGKTLDAGEGGAILTDNSDLYERLVWLTQHPYRHKRELGLGLGNEFALNLRIHPLAAVWADADFEPALQRLAELQHRMSGLVRVLDGSGLTRKLAYPKLRLQPTFFRLTAAWSGRSQPHALQEALAAQGWAAALQDDVLRPLHRDPAFQAQCGGHSTTPCPVTEDQARRRFEVHVAPAGFDAAVGSGIG
jgi:perosamine synthetase